MGRAPCCDKANVKKGPWSPDEDNTLRNFIHKHGTGGNWIALPRKAGLKRCGKSCRLRWLNYLRPDIKHGGFTPEEDDIICSLYTSLGSRWSVIASRLPGRTDNDVKNYWNTKLKKKLLAGSNTGRFDRDSDDNQITVTDSSTSISAAGQFSSSNINPAEAETPAGNGVTTATCTPTSSSYTTVTKYQQNYSIDDSGQLLDQFDDQFPLPGLMEYGTTPPPPPPDNSYSLSSSQQVSPSSFPLENSNDYAAWLSAEDDRDERTLTDLDFEGSHYLFSGSSFEEKATTEVAAPCFGIFSSSSSLANSNGT